MSDLFCNSAGCRFDRQTRDTPGSVDILGRPYEIQQGQNVCRPVRDGFRLNLVVDTTFRSAKSREGARRAPFFVPGRATKGHEGHTREQRPGHPQGVPLRLGWLVETSTSSGVCTRWTRAATNSNGTWESSANRKGAKFGHCAPIWCSARETADRECSQRRRIPDR